MLKRWVKYSAVLFILLLVLFCANVNAGTTTLDLTTPGDFGFIGDALFMQYSDAPTGNIDPFLTISADTQGHPQRGYNTDTAFGNYDEIYAAGKTHAIRLSEVPVANVDGIDYREFLLDINQSVQSQLSIDQIEIYLEATENISSHGGLSNLIYALNEPVVAPLDAGESSYDYILLDDSAGSGKGDMLALIPDAMFTGLDTQFVYMYSLTGLGLDGTDGFEEWGLSTEGALIPEPATICLLGLGGLALLKRRRA